MQRYMYSVWYHTIDGRYAYLITPRLVDIRRWRKSPAGQSATVSSYRRIPLAVYNEAYKARRKEFSGWDAPTLRLSSEEFDPFAVVGAEVRQ